MTAILLDVAVAALAVSVAIGLVRPDLGDVDALVAWTLTTAVVAAFVVAVDLAVLAAGTSLLGERLDERDVTLVVLVLAVVVYGPLRGWLGGLVRRLLLGRRGDRYGAVSALAARLETTGSVDEELPALAGAVAETFKVGHVRVEVLTPDGGRLSASHGVEPAELQEIDIAYRGERIGRLALPVQGFRSMLSRRDQGLLVDLVRQAAVAIRARLLATELQESRERLVIGREDDRRRIRRDLHDGLGPALGGVALRLQAAGNAIEPTPPAPASWWRWPGPRSVRRSTTYAASCTTCAHRPWTTSVSRPRSASRPSGCGPRSTCASTPRGRPGCRPPSRWRPTGSCRRRSPTWSSTPARAGSTYASTQAAALTVTVADDGRGIGPTSPPGWACCRCASGPRSSAGAARSVCPEGGGTTVRAVLPLRVRERSAR